MVLLIKYSIKLLLKGDAYNFEIKEAYLFFLLFYFHSTNLNILCLYFFCFQIRCINNEWRDYGPWGSEAETSWGKNFRIFLLMWKNKKNKFFISLYSFSLFLVAWIFVFFLMSKDYETEYDLKTTNKAQIVLFREFKLDVVFCRCLILIFGLDDFISLITFKIFQLIYLLSLPLYE